MRELRFVSLMSESADGFYAALSAYLAARLGLRMRVVDDVDWRARERLLYVGEAHLGVICGLQYAYEVDRQQPPSIQLLAAQVMKGSRYGDRPIYFSDVVGRADYPARSLAELQGARWAYNEPTSQSGYNITRYTLASRGHVGSFFGSSLESGAHVRSLEMVLEGTVDGSAIDCTVLEQQLRVDPSLARRIRVVETIGPSPIQPLVASSRLPAALRSEIQRAVLGMADEPLGAEVLSIARVSRFVRVSDTDYDPIRAMDRVASAVQL